MNTVIRSILTAALLINASGANAVAELVVTNVSGVFDSLIGGSNVIGAGTNQVWWGGDVGLGQSGYGFVGAAPPDLGPIEPDGENFILGEFTHFNKPIWPGTSITGAQLTVTMQGALSDLSSTPISIESVFDIIHNETTNQAPCVQGSVSICDDIVTFALNYGASESIVLDDVEYFITVEGFKIGGNFFENFMTEEIRNSSAQLVGQLTTIPIPTAALLFSLALLGIVKRGLRKRG